MAEKNVLFSIIGHLTQLLSGLSPADGGGINVGGLLSREDEIQIEALIEAIKEDRNKPGGPGDGNAVACAVRDFLEWFFPEGSILRWGRRILAGNRFRKHILSLTFVPPSRARAERRDRWGVTEDAVPASPGRDDRKTAIIFMGEWILRGRNQGTPDEKTFRSLVTELRRHGYPVGLPGEAERAINKTLNPLFSWWLWLPLLVFFFVAIGFASCSSHSHNPYA